MDENNVSNIDFLNKLQAEGILKQLISRGLLPLKVSFHREIYLQVHAQLLINGGNHGKAVSHVSSKLNIEPMTVYRALRFMKAA